MPIDFPNSPTVDQVYVSSDGRRWYWTGTVWNIVTTEFPVTAIQDQINTINTTLEEVDIEILNLDNAIDAIDAKIEDNNVLSVMGAI